MTTKILVETVQKVGKIEDIHFFENVAFEKNLPVTKNLKDSHSSLDWLLGDSTHNDKEDRPKNDSWISQLWCILELFWAVGN